MALGGFAPLPLPLGGTAVDGLTAEQHARLAADLAACVRTAPFAVVVFETDVTPVISGYIGQNGVGLAAAPDIVSNANGDVTLTWEAAYTDEYGNTWPTNLRHAEACVHATDAKFPTYEFPTVRSVRVRSWDAAGAAAGEVVMLVVY